MMLLRPFGTSCSRANVLRGAATLADDEALQAAMLFPETEALPDFRTASLDEILAVRIVVDHELNGSLVCDIATVPLNEL